MVATVTINSLMSAFDSIKPVLWMMNDLTNNKLRTVLLQHEAVSKGTMTQTEMLLYVSPSGI